MKRSWQAYPNKKPARGLEEGVPGETKDSGKPLAAWWEREKGESLHRKRQSNVARGDFLHPEPEAKGEPQGLGGHMSVKQTLMRTMPGEAPQMYQTPPEERNRDTLEPSALKAEKGH